MKFSQVKDIEIAALVRNHHDGLLRLASLQEESRYPEWVVGYVDAH